MYPLVVERGLAFFPCVYCVFSRRFATSIFHSGCVHFRHHLDFVLSLPKYLCFSVVKRLNISLLKESNRHFSFFGGGSVVFFFFS